MFTNGIGEPFVESATLPLMTPVVGFGVGVQVSVGVAVGSGVLVGGGILNGTQAHNSNDNSETTRRSRSLLIVLNPFPQFGRITARTRSVRANGQC